MQHDVSPATRRVWFMTSAVGIGGAQRRAAKVAGYVGSLAIFKEVILLTNIEMIELFQKDSEMMQILQSGSVKLQSIQDYGANNLPGTHLQERIIKKLDKYHKISRLFAPFYRFILRKLSWFAILDKIIGDNDIIHCFGGDTSRNGCLFLSQKRSIKILMELPGNNFLQRLARQMTIIYPQGRQELSHLVFKAVSETVYGNFTRLFPADYFPDKEIGVSTWAGPFIYVPQVAGNNQPVEKKKIIMFASRFEKNKNPDIFAKAIKIMLDSGELAGWSVKIRGRGSMEESIKDILSDYLSSEQVQIGFSFHLREELAESSIFVSIITTGNYPSQSIFEAMSQGNLLVLSDTGNSREKYGFPDVEFVELGVEPLIAGIRRAMAACAGPHFEEKSQRMREAFSAIARDNLYAKELLDIYEA